MPQNCGVLKKPKTYLNFGNIFTGNMVKPPLRGSENVLINLQNREIGNIPQWNYPRLQYLCIFNQTRPRYLLVGCKNTNKFFKFKFHPNCKNGC